MRAREVKVTLLAEQAKIKESLDTLRIQVSVLEGRHDDIERTLGLFEQAAPKARKPRTPKAAKPDAPTGELPEPGQEGETA